MKLNIKDLKVGQVVQFDRYAHAVFTTNGCDEELVCDFMFGTVMKDLTNAPTEEFDEYDNLPLGDYGRYGTVIINLHNNEHQDTLEEFDTGLGLNNLIFNFIDDPDYVGDSDYKKTYVTVINALSTYQTWKKNKEKLEQTYHVLIPVHGSVRASVVAKNPEEALERIKEGYYETDDGDFSLSDCTTCEDEIKLEDIVDLNE